MSLYRATLQTLGATVLLALALACSKKGNTDSSTTTATISGTVTYARVPLIKDAQGMPLGLADEGVATNLQSLPARSTAVRIYQQVTQTQPDGTTALAWVLAQSIVTDSTGGYSATVTKDRLTMVEVLSTFSGGNNTYVQLIAESQGINSTTPAPNRLHYAQRKAVDGTAPATTNVPSSMLSGNTTLNFSIGLNDAWWLVNPSYKLSSGEAPLVTQAVLETSLPGRTPGFGTGSRILGIGDTVASFIVVYGSATPGATLDLHYWPGRSEPRGSYIDYGPYDPTHLPQAFDASAGRYLFFGSLRGDSANDDAWDEGVIFPMLARNLLYAANVGRTFTSSVNPVLPVSAALTNLSPDLARIEGLPEAMAANLLKSPYLADTHGTALASPVIDIRDISSLTASNKSPYSAPALRAFAWELILKANSLPTPGVATNWTTINTLSAARFFLAPGLTNGMTDGTARDIEPLNIYSQLKRLSEAKSTAEPVDLAAVFTDAVLTPLAAPFGLPWPRPTTGTYAAFATDWGADPTGTFPSAVLSMAKAGLVNGLYPNLSQGEVFYAGFSLNADKRCTLKATITPALAAGTQVDVDLPRMPRTFTFTGSGGTTEAIVIPVSGTAPWYHSVRIKLKSPLTLQPDVTVTLTLTPTP